MSIDTIGNFLTCIRNSLMVSKASVKTPYSKMNHGIANILLEEGFIRGIEVVKSEKDFDMLSLQLKYVQNESVIHELTRISSPKCRVYAGARKIKHVKGGLGFSILTTPKGIMTNKKARKLSVGGELLCVVW